MEPSEAKIDRQTVIEYKNHRGVTSIRTILPESIFWGSSEWHPQPQWLLNAYDVDKKAYRWFAMRDIKGWDVYAVPSSTEGVKRMLSPIEKRRLDKLRSIPKNVELSDDKEALKALHEQLYLALVAGQSLDDLGEEENKKVMEEMERLQQLFDQVKAKLTTLP